MLVRTKEPSFRVKSEKNKRARYYANFKCDCGNIIIRRTDTVAKSCGCLNRKERYLSSHGYVLIYINGKHIYEHKHIIEKQIGRKLNKKEQVHHIDRNKENNKISNLVLCKSAKEHNRYNKGWYKKYSEWYKKCPKCGKELMVKNNFYKCKKQYYYICKECSNKKNRKVNKDLNKML